MTRCAGRAVGVPAATETATENFMPLTENTLRKPRRRLKQLRTPKESVSRQIVVERLQPKTDCENRQTPNCQRRN